MQTLFDDPMIPEICRRGVRDAAEFASLHLPCIQLRTMEEWLTQLNL